MDDIHLTLPGRDYSSIKEESQQCPLPTHVITYLFSNTRRFDNRWNSLTGVMSGRHLALMHVDARR
jgi:hypothetical protein